MQAVPFKFHQETAPLAAMLSHFSTELTAKDAASISAAGQYLGRGAEVFIASLPKNTVADFVGAARSLVLAKLIPVPHIVARNISGRDHLEDLVKQLVDVGVTRVLVLGGDRDLPIGQYDCALDLIKSDVLRRHGIKRIYLGCYPEGHPRISQEALLSALKAKLAVAKGIGHHVELISQFCFEAQPVIDFTRALRGHGIDSPLRVGVAGPADHALLVKYALICGVGASMRALQERGDLTRNMLTGVTPETLLRQVGEAMILEPELNIVGTHFFTFGSLARSAKWARQHS